MLALFLVLLSVQDALSFCSCHVVGQQSSAAAAAASPHHVTPVHSDGDCGEQDVGIRNGDAVSQSRRLMIMTIPTLAFTTSKSAQASTGSVRTKIKPQTAYEGLVKARDELQQAEKKYLQKKDYDGLRYYLENAENMNNFEPNALAIVASNKLHDEDKKAIGTIRRYGSGADVIIMYGGLLAEIDGENEDPDYATVQKYMTRTMESLDEVISICRNGGFA